MSDTGIRDPADGINIFIIIPFCDPLPIAVTACFCIDPFKIGGGITEIDPEKGTDLIEFSRLLQLLYSIQTQLHDLTGTEFLFILIA